MRGLVRRPVAPELRDIIREASQALERLEPERLEELSEFCAALQGDFQRADAAERAEFARQARQAAMDMDIYARILAATSANLEVMRRLRDLREGRLEYAVPATKSEDRYGID